MAKLDWHNVTRQTASLPTIQETDFAWCFMRSARYHRIVSRKPARKSVPETKPNSRTMTVTRKLTKKIASPLFDSETHKFQLPIKS